SETITLDTTPPEVVKITEVVSDAGKVAYDGFTSDDTLTVKGTAEPNSVVNIWVGLHDANSPTGWSDLSPGHILVQVDSNGNWSIDLPKLPADGSYRINAVARDAAGNDSHDTHTGYDEFGYSFSLDTKAPDTPSGVTITDDVTGGVVGTLGHNGLTNDNRPAFAGKAEPGSTVTIKDTTTGKTLGTAEVNTKGEWSFTPETALDDGTHRFEWSATDQAGNTSAGGAQTIVVDTTPPGKLTITGLTDDVDKYTGNVDKNGLTNDSRPTLTGEGAEPNATIVITAWSVTEGKTIEIGRGTADSNGKWSVTVTDPLADGKYNFGAYQIDSAGNVGPNLVYLDQWHNITVDTKAAALTITGLADNVGMYTDDVAKNGFTDDNRPTLKGEGAEPNATVVITAWSVTEGKTIEIGSGTADSNGKWSVTVTDPLADGKYNFGAYQIDSAGNVGPNLVYLDQWHNITVDTKAPKTQNATITNDVSGKVIDGNTYTNDNTPTITGKGEAGSTVTIKDSITGVLLGTAKVDGNGNWSFTPTTALADGQHAYQWTETDAAGNVGDTGTRGFHVDTVVAKPTVTLNDDFGASTGPVTNGGTTDDVTPKWTGKVEAGAEVQVMTPGGIIVEKVGTVDSAGNWTYQHGTFEDGTFTYKIRQVDKAGNTSDWTESKFTIDSLTSGTSGNNAVFYAPQSGTLTLEITYNRWAEVTKVVGKVSTWNGYDAPSGAVYAEYVYKITSVYNNGMDRHVVFEKYVVWAGNDGKVIDYTFVEKDIDRFNGGVDVSGKVGQWVYGNVFDTGIYSQTTTSIQFMPGSTSSFGSRDITQ
ncbi:TPA: hypothetical protein JAN03_24735, partial [Citrobacter freundii]|nr:hypothetical protein [Citrobacter freundii]